MNFATVSYAVAAAAYGLLALVLLAGWRRRPLAARLLVATVATALWAGVLAIGSSRDRIPFFWVFGAEVLRDISWLVLLTAMARDFAPRSLILGVHALWMSVLAAGVLLLFLGRDYVGASGAL